MEGKRWDEMNRKSLKFQKEGGRKGKPLLQLAGITSVCSPQPPAPCAVTFLSPFMGRLVLLIQTSDPLPQSFVASQRERNEKKTRRSKTLRGRGRRGEKMEKLWQSNAGEKMGVNKRDGGIKGESLEERSHSFWHK